MPIFITQGRYTRDAVKGMVARPEDRAEQVSRLISRIGGKLIGYYVTFGEYDFLTIADVPDPSQMAAALLMVAGSGGVTDLKTTVALTPSEAKGAYAAAGELARTFRPAGGA